jgi:hypothetical protein
LGGTYAKHGANMPNVCWHYRMLSILVNAHTIPSQTPL